MNEEGLEPKQIRVGWTMLTSGYVHHRSLEDIGASPAAPCSQISVKDGWMKNELSYRFLTLSRRPYITSLCPKSRVTSSQLDRAEFLQLEQVLPQTALHRSNSRTTDVPMNTYLYTNVWSIDYGPTWRGAIVVNNYLATIDDITVYFLFAYLHIYAYSVVPNPVWRSIDNLLSIIGCRGS